jgi:predicted DNA-binding transcriptional regulator YafY
MTQTSGRLLQLLSLLQAQRHWPGEELAQRLEVSGRTIRRDVDRLRELGYPIEAMTGPTGGYRLHAGTAMPPLLLDDDEAVAIAVGLRTAAGASVTGIEETAIRALVKLEQVLPAPLRRRVNALQSATVTRAATGTTVDPEVLTAIAGACRDHERLRFAYTARDGAGSRRLVEPHSLVNLGRRWYLVAWDCEREAWRSFRVDRLARPAATGGRFSARKVPGGDAAAFVASSRPVSTWRHQARVTVHAPAQDVKQRMGGTVTAIDDATCEYRAGDDNLDWLAVRVLMLGAEVDVHDPPELVAHIDALAGRMSRAVRR